MHFSLAFILFIRIFGFVNESNKQIDTFSQLRLPLIVLITFAHSYSGVRAGDYIVETMSANVGIFLFREAGFCLSSNQRKERKKRIC